jgi:predicted HTH transcriptional regulator
MKKKKYKPISKCPTALTEKDISHIRRIAIRHLKSHEFLTNRELRGIVDISYDQAIYFYRRMLDRGVLERVGIASGTKYILKDNKRK